jgi:ubiquinone/menaquinone biosynthesis C-methylase UbiE
MQTPGDNPSRIYKNDGNASLIALLDEHTSRVLDVGCGAGDNAGLVKSKYPACEIYGVTYSAAEAAIAKQRMNACWVFDIESEIPGDLCAMRFDALIFSHVLEHMRDPATVLKKFANLLVQGGCAIIAVPNTLSWAMRWQFLRGDFEYKSDGVLDDTHLRFFTYMTADRFLLGKTPELKLVSKSVAGSVPQWWLRRYLLPRSWSHSIDALGCRIWPNLFGDQVLIKAARLDSPG